MLEEQALSSSALSRQSRAAGSKVGLDSTFGILGRDVAGDVHLHTAGLVAHVAYQDKDYVWSVDANRFVMAESASLPPGRALDLAAGEGRNAVWLAEQGWTVRANRLRGVDRPAAGSAGTGADHSALGTRGRAWWHVTGRCA